MRWLIPLALAVVGILFSRQSSAAINPGIPHVPDARDYFPVQSGGTFLQPDPAGENAPQSAVEYADPWELWGAVNIFDAPVNRVPEPAYQPTPQPELPVAEPVQYVRQAMNPEANLKAFLSVIRQIEPSPPQSYTSLVGGGQFSDFSDHPARKGWPGVNNSTAAGAYQITLRTWNEVLKRTPLPDFSPQSQDIAAVTILQFPWRQNAYSDVIAGNFDMAVRKLALEWEAFEKMLAGNYPVTLAQAREHYAQAGGGFPNITQV